MKHNLGPGIFCLEGQWAQGSSPSLLDRTTVYPQLLMLEQMKISRGVIHRDVATKEEFEHYAREWARPSYRNYPIAYFASHGIKSGIALGRDQLSLGEIAQMLRGKLSGRTVYFGSCNTLAASEVVLMNFCKSTGAKAIAGYTKPVEWLSSASFDFILIPELMRAKSIRPIYARLLKNHQGFVRELEFRIATSTWASPRKPAQSALNPK